MTRSALFSGRKAQILDTLSDMLSQADCGRVTTAALAARLALSEGALYRHFNGKSDIYAALIEQAEALIAEDLDHIAATESDARTRLRKSLLALRLFAERHPGLARVLTGHAIAGESPGLLEQANAVIDGLQGRLAQDATRTGPGLGAAPDTAACVLTHWVLGCWQRQAMGGPPASESPDDDLAFFRL
jgi:TetR/AcrR family transcriptional regulator